MILLIDRLINHHHFSHPSSKILINHLHRTPHIADNLLVMRLNGFQVHGLHLSPTKFDPYIALVKRGSSKSIIYI